MLSLAYLHLIITVEVPYYSFGDDLRTVAIYWIIKRQLSRKILPCHFETYKEASEMIEW
jgi:hypothetical protein